MKSWLLFTLSWLRLVSTEIYTSSAHIESWLESESRISDLLHEHVNLDEESLQPLQKLIESYETLNNEYRNRSMDDLNPVEALLFIKQKLSQWKNIESILQENSAKDAIEAVRQERMANGFPNEQDVRGAIGALLRLQNVYAFETEDLANGIVGNKQFKQRLEVDDCYEVGRFAAREQDFAGFAASWIELALKRLDEDSNAERDPRRGAMLEILPRMHLKAGNIEEALSAAQRLVKINPGSVADVVRYQAMLEKKESMEKAENQPSATNNTKPPKLERLGDMATTRAVYRALCRGEAFETNLTLISELYSYYKRDRPFLILAPIKVQILHFEPLVVLFKDAITDGEIETIKKLAIPKLSTARSSYFAAPVGAPDSNRVSKSAWLDNSEHVDLQALNRRVDLMTNLDQSSSEPLQVANYGLGGHFNPHFDFIPSTHETTKKDGNRIATLLFYLSKPSQGGGTAFIYANIVVMPEANDAVFWYNTDRSGGPDPRSIHAACPVITGAKWAANKWMRTRHQEFRRPCGLKWNILERYVGDLGGPEPRNQQSWL